MTDGSAKSKSNSSQSTTRHELFNEANIVRKDEGSAKYCPDDPDGAICKMTHYDAVQYCKEQGGHLLSTRELSQFLNPDCILEPEYIENDLIREVPDGYYLVASEDEDGNQDAFYFSNAGSRPLASDLAKNSFWTSSLVLGKPDYAHVFYGPLGGGGGPPHEHARSYRHAVILIGSNKRD